MELRRGLLHRCGVLPRDWFTALPPKGAASDDLLDALAGLTVALDIARGGGQCFPDPPGRDAHGLPVAIWTLSLRLAMTISRADIEAAHARIAPYARRTPTWNLERAFGHDGPVSLKLEFLQHAGSFKTRGAFNTLSVEARPGRWRRGGVRRQSRRRGGLCGTAARREGPHLRAGDFEPREDRGHPLATAPRW